MEKDFLTVQLLNLDLRPGVFKNGTSFAARGRWFESNLVRWHDSSLRPIGGWERRRAETDQLIPSLVADPVTETVRDLFAYRANDNALYIACGSNSNVYVVSNAGVVTNITPTGFVGGSNNVTTLTGFGIGAFGAGPFGVARTAKGGKVEPVPRWSFDTWGENLLASFPGETLFEGTPGNQLAPLSNAPDSVIDFLVTDERIVIALVDDVSSKRRIEWSDREDNNNWTPAVDNYAGGFNLRGAGNLVAIHQVQNQYIVLTETDAHLVRYVNAPFVFGFTKVGDQCGPLDKKSIVATDRFVMWQGERTFWMFDGNLQPVQCDVMDHINKTMDRSKLSKMVSHTISDYSEIWWAYQSKTGSDVDSYVYFNYLTRHWGYGTLPRTAATDKGASLFPVMVDSEGYLYNHEQVNVQPDGTAYAMTGPLVLETGKSNFAMSYMFPDTEGKGQVEFEFFSRQHSTDPLYSHGVYQYDDPVSTIGVSGKEVFIKVTGLTNDWEFGVPRVYATQGGDR